MQDIDRGVGCARVRTGVVWERLFALSAHFCCELKTARRIKFINKNKLIKYLLIINNK